MNDLTLIQRDGGAYVDSREVAALIDKPHNDLMKSIRRYSGYLTEGRISLSDFFLESTYADSTGRTLPCYLLTKMGCEMVANKLTGEKGVLFTAAYVSKFNEMEQRERTELDALATMRVPRLGEINACVRIIFRGLKYLGAPPEQIMQFLKDTYESFGFKVDIEPFPEPPRRWYTAREIAEECGIYSLYGRSHAHAVACILNENILIGESHKRVVSADYDGYTGVSVQYDDYALREVLQWLIDCDLPDDIYGYDRTYHVQYCLE